ncbi:MAG: putative Ig domain-containing protein [Blastocatellia bacterium]
MPAYLKASQQLLLLCILFCCAPGVRASTFMLPTDDDLMIGARVIVRGKVISTGCRLDADSGRIFTYIRLRVQEVFKGEITEREVVLKEEGGQVGTRGSVIFGTPQFQKGDRVLLYLDTWRDGSLRVYQKFLGKFSIIIDPVTGEQLVVRDSPGKNTSLLQRSPGHESGGPITSRMGLSVYREMLRTRLSANRRSSRRFNEIHYNSIPVLAEPIEYRGISAGDLEPQYTFLTSPPTRWFEPDLGQPVVFIVNTDGAPNAQVMDDISAAMNAWSSVPGCSIRVVNGGSGAVCFAHDINTIVFNNCDFQFPPSPTCASVLALGGLNWDSSQTKVINGTTFVRAAGGHISFNPYASCDFGIHCVVQEIATHELGHALGLGHSQFADATMAGTAHFDGRCASLRQDDINAITFVYPATGGGPGPLTVLSTSPLGIATAGSAFSRQLLASGGGNPYSWSLVSGTLPNGLTLFPGGLITGTPSATGTSDFTVRVTDPQNVTAEKALSIIVVAPSTGYDSQFASQSVPTTLKPDQSFFTTVRWINTGSKPWDGASGFKASSQNPANNTTWGGDTVVWLGFPIAPGEELVLLFQAYAPSRPGIYDFQWQLYQPGVGFYGQMSTNVSITVGDPSTLPSPPTINSPSVLAAVKGTFFTHLLTATGGTPPYNWQVVTGPLPAGLSLNPNTGALTGTPGAAGNSPITLQVTDSRFQTAQKALTIAVSAPPVPPVEITTTSLPSPVKGTNFNQQLSATGGKPPYTWAVTGGALPSGLTLAAASGVISGTPLSIGSFSFTATASDAESRTASKLLAITIAPPPLSLIAVPLLEGFKGSAFGYLLGANGGTPPYAWSVSSGALPAGLTLNPSTGLISGAPTVAGLFVLTVTVRDQGSLSAATTVQIKLIDPETIPSIIKAKYKNGKKLIVTGNRINAAALLIVDGVQTSATPTDGSFVVKPIKLLPGRHEIRIVNPGAVSSTPYLFTVE